MHSGFAQFAAFDQDAVDNNAAAGKPRCPCRLWAEKSFAPMMATVIRFAADDVHEGAVPDCAHWIMDENPEAPVRMVREFLH